MQVSETVVTTSSFFLQMLQTELLPHTVRDHASSVVETLAQHVTAAANREKQVAMRQMVNDLLQNDVGDSCVVHSMKFDGKQVCAVIMIIKIFYSACFAR